MLANLEYKVASNNTHSCSLITFMIWNVTVVFFSFSPPPSLGLLEKAIFYAEFENVNKYGQSVGGAIIFAELMSCLERALARMLLIIVSLGYGITR